MDIIMKKKIEEKELEILKIKEKIKAVEEEFEIEKAEIEKKYDLLIMEKEKETENLKASILKHEQEQTEKLQVKKEFITKVGKELDIIGFESEIELMYLDDPAYKTILRVSGVDTDRINEPEYRSFLESKGVKFLTEEMSNERIEARKLKQEQHTQEQAKNLGEFITEVKEIELIYINNPAYRNYLVSEGIDPELIINEPKYRSFLESIGINFITENVSKEKYLQSIKVGKELDLSKLNNDIELTHLDLFEYKVILKSQGVDTDRINEPEYRLFLESKGIKFLTEDMSNEKCLNSTEVAKELNLSKFNNEIELKYINIFEYKLALKLQGVDTDRINEPEYQAFLESKGVNFKLSDESGISHNLIIESEDQSSTLIGSDIIQEENFN
jgi:hypothetical protein